MSAAEPPLKEEEEDEEEDDWSDPTAEIMILNQLGAVGVVPVSRPVTSKWPLTYK